MQRIPHDSNGTWLQRFEIVNNDPLAKRQYLDNASYLLYSIIIGNTGGVVAPTYPGVIKDNKVEIKFGQFVSPQRNLSLIRKFYFDYDISINKKGRFHSNPEPDEVAAKLNLLVDNELAKDMCTRLGFGALSSASNSFVINFPQNFYKLYLGYNHIRNFSTNVDPINKYEAIVSDVLATIDDDCFTWVEIKNNVIDMDTVPDLDLFYKSSALMFDFKLVLDIPAFEAWVASEFSPTDLQNLLDAIGTSAIELNFIFYPPVASGMQIEDVPKILTPNGILKNRLVEEVIFSVSRSFVDSSQKIFEINFSDNTTGETIYKANSLENYEDFTLITKDTNIVPEYLEIENSVFEELSGITYPTSQFKVTYTIPNDLKKYLASHLNYKITVRMTDLTSERTDVS